ncbi:hypothetical protein D3C72_2115060 [compost metagenome]
MLHIGSSASQHDATWQLPRLTSLLQLALNSIKNFFKARFNDFINILRIKGVNFAIMLDINTLATCARNRACMSCLHFFRNRRISF